MNYFEKLPQVVGLFLAFILMATIFIMLDQDESVEDELMGVCGVDSTASIYNSAERERLFQRGKSLFRNACAMCHDQNMVDDLTGPALEDFLGRWDNDTLAFYRYLQSPRIYIDTTTNEYLLKIHEEFGGMPKPDMPDLTLEDIEGLIMYCRPTYH